MLFLVVALAHLVLAAVIGNADPQLRPWGLLLLITMATGTLWAMPPHLWQDLLVRSGRLLSVSEFLYRHWEQEVPLDRGAERAWFEKLREFITTHQREITALENDCRCTDDCDHAKRLSSDDRAKHLARLTQQMRVARMD